MALFHMAVNVISRGAGRSAIAAAAYRSAEELHCERENRTHNYTRKQAVVYKEILALSNAPTWAKVRQQLWNKVESAEKRKDAQLAREVEVALPVELSRPKQIELVREYAQQEFVARGMVADIAVHDKGDGNPHAHILLTTRSIDEGGFGKKDRTWNDRELLKSWRKEWEISTNKELDNALSHARVDCRSLKDQGIDRLPTKHLGHINAAQDRRTGHSVRGDFNREILAIDKEKKGLNQEKTALHREIAEQAPPAAKERAISFFDDLPTVIDSPKHDQVEVPEQKQSDVTAAFRILGLERRAAHKSIKAAIDKDRAALERVRKKEHPVSVQKKHTISTIPVSAKEELKSIPVEERAVVIRLPKVRVEHGIEQAKPPKVPEKVRQILSPNKLQHRTLDELRLDDFKSKPPREQVKEFEKLSELAGRKPRSWVELLKDSEAWRSRTRDIEKAERKTKSLEARQANLRGLEKISWGFGVGKLGKLPQQIDQARNDENKAKVAFNATFQAPAVRSEYEKLARDEGKSIAQARSDVELFAPAVARAREQIKQERVVEREKWGKDFGRER